MVTGSALLCPMGLSHWIKAALVTWLMSPTAGRVSRNWEAVLMDDLLLNYNRNARPTYNVHQTVNVSIVFYLTKILGLDEKNQILTTFGWLEVHWYDEFLVWNASDYGGIKRVIIPPDKIWLPDFGLENSAEAIYDEQADRKFRAGIEHNGWVQWVPGGKFVTSCQLDITLYPFDWQRCDLDFIDWTYDARFVNLYNGSQGTMVTRGDVTPPVCAAEVGTDVYKKHGEWEIVKTRAWRREQEFESDPGITFPTVKFQLYLKRKPRFYMINVVAPCILMSILALLVFHLPPDSGEKVSLGITVLLSFSVFLLLIAENVPKTSDYVPLIGIYLTMVMVMTAFSIVVSVVVLDLHHHEPNQPVPRWLRTIVFDCLGRAICVKRYYGEKEGEGLFQMMKAASQRTSACNYLSAADEEENGHISNSLGSLGQTGLGGADVLRGLYGDLDSVLAPPRKKRPLLEEIVHHLRDITAKMKRDIKREQIQEEWKTLATILDRFLLIMFFLTITGLTVSILYIYPELSMDQEAFLNTLTDH